MQAKAKIFAKESAADFAADKAAMAQNRTFEELKKAMQKAKSYLRTSIDTNRIESGIKLIEKDFVIAGDGVLTNRGSAQTFRNLTATSKITAELLSKALERKVMLDQRQQQLHTFRYQLDSLLSVPALFQFPADSVSLIKYIQQIGVMNYDVHPVDSMLKQTSIKTQTLLNQTNMLVFKLQTALEEIAVYQKDLASNSFKREFEYLWNPAVSYRPFGEILGQAWAKAWLTLAFYLENNVGKLLILALIVFSSFLYLRSLKNIYKENELLVKDFEGQLVLRYPIFSSILLSVNIFQFIFLSPPFILNVLFWTISCICLSMLFRKFISKYWMRVWLLMVCLFLVTAFDNLILQASRTERWMMLPLALAGMLSGIMILWRGNRAELREKMILISIAFMTVLEFGSIIANGLGRYNMAKTLLISGYLNVVVAILFLWTIRLINEGLLLAFSVYTRQDKKLFYLNFDKVGKKVPAPFYILLVVGWVILFGRNFAGFEYLSGPFRNFFESERTLGSYTFSINSLVLFFVIMGVAVIVSKVVSFFASDGHLVHNKDEKNTRQGIGSWLLLVRITILSIGLFLAIAAAGIPIDKITIVLGALGVGIGFGLQTMVNHLVSGLIIAFEKPVNVGDIVDVDGQAGTMKSIGFRSSVITTWDGADVVMPNGDLLNSHLVNWSLGGNRKRVSISIGIDYDADLEMVKKLLLDILNEEPRILKKSPPFVQYEQFGTSTIDIRLFFWAKDFREANAVKSDLIISITATFRKEGIKIPFPQHDIHIQGPGLTDEKKP
ncbi:mechanosensitive ion channel protein [Pedobacter sp. BAL39]|nr:mechanosensitive ion channel protein [Pedobacter sp. BAL39]